MSGNRTNHKRHTTERAAGQPHSVGTGGKSHNSHHMVGRRVMREAGAPPARGADGTSFTNPPASKAAQLQTATYNASGGRY
jgi:hypothetical protein